MSICTAIRSPRPQRTGWGRRGLERPAVRRIIGAERLESRDLLAVTITQTTQNLRFVIDLEAAKGSEVYGEYQAFDIATTATVTDAWVKATGFDPLTEKVRLGAGEDGLYRLGQINPGDPTHTAFFYLTADEYSLSETDPQTYTIEVYEGDPGAGGTLITSANYQFDYVVRANETDDGVDKVVSSYIGPSSLVVGDTFQVQVTGRLKNNADKILFAPATALDWPADAFQLEAASVSLNGNNLGPNIIFDGAITPAERGDFVATYTFRVTSPTSGPTPIRATQYTLDTGGGGGLKKFDHSVINPLEAGVIPQATYALAVDKTSFRNGIPVDTYIPGLPLRYVIELENVGDEELTNVPVSDILPADIASSTLVSVITVGATASIGLVAGTLSGTLTSVLPGGTVTITIDTTVSAAATLPLSNTFTATLPGDITASDTDIDYRDVVLVVDKTSYRGGIATDTYVQGAALQYVATVTNTTALTGTDIVVSDQLPAKLSWAAATLSYTVTGGGTATLALNPATGLVSGLTTLDPGAVLTITVDTVVLADASQSIVNTMSATVPNGQTFSDTDTDWPDVALAVTKTSSSPAGTDTYVPGATFTYVVAFTNDGPADETGILIGDVLPGQLTVTFGQIAVDWGGNVPGTYDLFDHTLFGTINLDGGSTVTFTITTIVPLAATGTMTNEAIATLPVGTSASAEDVDEPIDLFLLKTDNRDVYYAGGTTTYDITVRNDGAADVTGIAFQDLLTTNTNLDLAITSWYATYTNASGTLPTVPTKNDIIGTLALEVGGVVRVTINAKITPTASGNLVNTATISAGILLASSTDTNRPGGSVVPQPGDAAIIVSTDDGCRYPPSVFVIDPTGAILQTITWQQGLFEKSFRGGVRVTTGDVNGDGLADLVVGSGRGRVGEIRVFLGQSGHPGGIYYQYDSSYNTKPFGTSYTGGVEVAVGDIDGDRDGDLIAARSSGTPTVSGFVVDAGAPDPVANTPKFTFRAFPSPYANGTMIAAGDFTGDGIVEVVAGSNSGIRATVRVWNVAGSPAVTRTIYPIAPTFKGGVTVWVGRYADAMHPDDGVPDVFVGAGLNGQSVTEVYSGASGTQLLRTQAFATLSRTAARLHLAGLDLVGNGVVTDLYGVRGLNGSGGATGVRRMQLPSTATSWFTQYAALAPPLRIASVVPPTPPPENGFRGLAASRTVRR